MNGLRNNGDPLLDGPAETDLCRSMCILCAKDAENIIIQISTTRQRGIGLHLDPVCLTVFNKLLRITERMTFNLIYRRDNTGYLAEFFEMTNLKIADTDRKGTTGFEEFLHFLPGVQITARNWPVNEIKINVIKTEAIQTSLKSSINISETLSIVPDLGGYEQILPRDAAPCNAASDILFVLICRSGVDQTIAILYCCSNGVLSFIIGSCFI